MRIVVFALAALVTASESFAQTLPPPAPHVDHPPLAVAPSFEIDRGGGNGVKILVHCGERDTTKECMDAASALVDKALEPTPAK